MVIVTDCAYRSSIAAIHALHSLNEEVIGITTDSVPNPPAFYSKYLKEHYVLPSDKNLYTDELLKICSQHQRPVILPIGVFTLDIISASIEKFREVCDFCVSDPNTLQILNDKSETKKLAESVEINVPKIFTEGISFPAVVKPVCGEKLGLKASDRYKIVNNETELDSAKECYSSSEIVIEEYIQGNGVGVSIVMGNNHQPYSAFCHKRLSEYPASGGPSCSLITFRNDELIKKTVKLLAQANFSGIAMVEYKERNGKFYFLEVNPRIWGSFSATTKAKSDFIKAYIESSKNNNYKFSPSYQIGKKVKFLPNIFASVLSYIKIKNPKKALNTVIDALNPFVPNGVFNIKDPVPALKDIFRKRR